VADNKVYRREEFDYTPLHQDDTDLGSEPTLIDLEAAAKSSIRLDSWHSLS
jgi:hypothetical protein